MKALFLRAPYQFELRDVDLRPLAEDEVLVEVKACGFCGHDNILAKYWAKDWEPFGHEFAGVIVEKGARAARLNVGDHVTIQTSTFNPYSAASLNGRVDLDTEVIDYMSPAYPKSSMGFAEFVIVPECLCVRFTGLSFEQASFIEPLGVALDMVKTAEIRLNDDVLMLGSGPIGLMALQMVRASGARRIYVADLSQARARGELARRMGADELIHTDLQKLEDYPFARGGVDRVLLSAPPATIDAATQVCLPGGIVSYIGISYGEAARVSFDSNCVHLRKIQIRGSNAIPALYFPEVIDLLQSGTVRVDELITHRFALEEAPAALSRYAAEPQAAVKAVLCRS